MIVVYHCRCVLDGACEDFDSVGDAIFGSEGWLCEIGVADFDGVGEEEGFGDGVGHPVIST